MRSSIACLRCRRSKIKCENDGGSSPCETCIKQGKDCKYPEASPLPPKRTAESFSSSAATKTELGDNGSHRKRLKKTEVVSRAGEQYAAAAHAEDVLSAHYLTSKLWCEVFDLYRLHFATELPFLHLPTLKEYMGSKSRATQKDSSPETSFVLLGILTLTARFHQDLVKYATHTANTLPAGLRGRLPQNKTDSSAASEFFAEALRKALGPLGTTMTTASVERVQAFLMLGLYEWSQSRARTGGLGAWMYVGVAIRMAQVLGLGSGDKPVPKSKLCRMQRDSTGSTARASLPPPERMILKEIKRRTMFSCLILDRLLSCGKERVSTIRSEDLQIQLPCNEWAFDLSKDVKTGFLKGPEDESPRDIEDDSVLSRFLRLVDLWGEISTFSFAGGRLVEEYPPWDPRTRFFQLRNKLQAFNSDLPSTFTLSTSNYHKHENQQASSVYVSLHMLGSVCHIILYREYIPFLPVRCDKPVGPLDEFNFPEGKYDVPEGFWEDSAVEVFRSARDIVDLIGLCHDKLPMSALVSFAIWTAAFVGQYAWHFPHMDQQRHMLAEDEDSRRETWLGLDVTKAGPIGICYQTLSRISGWVKMASTYAGYLKEIDAYISKVKKFYRLHLQHPGRFTGTANLYEPDFCTSNRPAPPIRRGDFEEWTKRNSKIINNGMNMACTASDEHPSGGYEPSDKSRASTIEPGAVGDTYSRPKPAAGGIFTTTNVLHGLASTPRQSSAGHPSPTHETPGGDHQNQQLNMDVVEHLREWEGSRIADCLGEVGGDIQGFSYGDVPDVHSLFGSVVPVALTVFNGEGLNPKSYH